jgi:competence protein ComEA
MRASALLVILVAALASLGLRRRPAPPPDRPAAAAPRPGQPLAAGLLFGGRLDLAAATAQDLEALPGIGPVRARRIARTHSLAVPGIGARTLERLRKYLQ